MLSSSSSSSFYLNQATWPININKIHTDRQIDISKRKKKCNTRCTIKHSKTHKNADGHTHQSIKFHHIIAMLDTDNKSLNGLQCCYVYVYVYSRCGHRSVVAGVMSATRCLSFQLHQQQWRCMHLPGVIRQAMCKSFETSLLLQGMSVCRLHPWTR